MNTKTIKELRERADEMIAAGITNKDAPSDKELAKRGLAPRIRNVWSLVDAEDGD